MAGERRDRAGLRPIATDAVKYVLDARGVSEVALQNMNLTRAAGATARVVARADNESRFELP